MMTRDNDSNDKDVCPKKVVSGTRTRHHSGQLPNQTLSRINLPAAAADVGHDGYRCRSGSFNPTILTSNHGLLTQPEKNALSRERSYTDINKHHHQMQMMAVAQYATMPRRLRRPSTIVGSDESVNSLIYDESDLQVVQCLLPTGLIIDVSVHPDDEMYHIKQIVLAHATTDEKLPLRGCLNPDANCYYVFYVSVTGLHEEVIDENKTLRELKPFLNILKFAKRTNDRNQYQFKRHIGKLIGIDLNRFDKMRSCEINDFRWRMKVFANRLAQDRRARLKTSWRDRIIYQYPPRLVMNKINNQATKKIKVDLKWDDFTETEVDNDTTAESLVKELGRKYGFEDDHVDQCCIKTIGEASYLLGGHMLKDYAFIKENSVPRLVVVSLDTIEIEMASDNIYISLERDVLAMGNGFSSSPCTPQSPSAPASPRSLPRKTSLTSMSLYNLAASSPFQYSTTLSTSIEDKFKIKIETINISMDVPNSGAKFCLQVGLFHGGRQICPLETIVMFKGRPSVVEGDHQGILEVDREVEFDILVSCLPRMTKLCFGFFEKRKTTQHPLSWVNTNVFDYMSKMRKSDTLHMWKYFLGTVMPTCEMLSPLRCNVSNVNSRESITSIVLTIQDDLDHQKKVQFPNSVGKTTPMMPINEHSNNGFNNNTRITKLYGEELVSIANYDPLHQVTVQEKELIWNVRTYCMNLLPQLLPRIIDCVDYSNMNHVAELHYLLERWPLLSPEDALQLLDYAYPDEAVRSFAVKSLRVASDDTITCYLLQLAQALKHESYLQCDLVEFLLERALNNQHIGHHLFWELKAEMNSPTAGLLYGLILEAYLAAAPEHLKLLEHQMTLLDKCRETHLNLQKMEVTTRSYEKAKNRFAASMRSQFYGHHPYRNFVNPLNPSQKCKRLIIDKCRLMNSKMRPQMLFFDNVDTNHLASNDLDDIVLMFKKGDDLRQDRLTLQLLTVMDRIWKEDGGLDLRLNVYRAVSTDLNEGFIQVVMNAETVCKIQMKQVPDNKLKLTAALNKGLILSWLKSHNPSPEQMKRAQWEFTQSCAGYSVATYILGIADRHNDNIMVRTNGQLFHIDFGHFLGNYKYKFGIKRERVPMVLPAEFVEVIRVADFGNVNNFETFRQLCEQAFVTIRRRAGLIISLLKMMISTGLPELNSDQDLNIVRTTLHLDQVSEQEALELFRKDFNESLRNAWTISINWWVHMMNQMRSKGVK